MCVTSSGPSIPLSTAYSQILPSASGRVYLDAGGQRQFIDYLGFSSCSGGGENLLPTALIQVFNTTATMTTTFSGFLAAVSASLTIAPVCAISISFKASFIHIKTADNNVLLSSRLPPASPQAMLLAILPSPQRASQKSLLATRRSRQQPTQ